MSTWESERFAFSIKTVTTYALSLLELSLIKNVFFAFFSSVTRMCIALILLSSAASQMGSVNAFYSLTGVSLLLNSTILPLQVLSHLIN